MLRLLSPTGQSCAPPIKVVAVSVTSCTTSFGNTIDRVIALNLSDGGFRWKFATGTLRTVLCPLLRGGRRWWAHLLHGMERYSLWAGRKFRETVVEARFCRTCHHQTERERKFAVPGQFVESLISDFSR